MSFDEQSETRGHLLGISTGWDEAADFMLDEATACFRAGSDDAAVRMRGYARTCREKASERRTAYDKYKEEYARDE